LEDVSAIRFLGNEIVKKHPVVKTWGVGSPAEIDLDSLVQHEGKYRPIRKLGLGSAYPVVEGYKDTVALGWHLNFEDPMQFNQLDITASYSVDGSLPDEERWHASIKYQAINWSFSYRHNGADFYDLFGPTKRARKGDLFNIGYEQEKFKANLAYYSGLDTLPANQNVAATSSDILSANLSFGDSHTRKSLGAVDHEQGYQWSLVGSASHADSDTFSKLRGGFNAGFSLPWRHASIWTYTSAGVSQGERLNTLSNFYFGGFGNNYVDDGKIKRYRSYDSLPGFEIGEVSAGSFAKTVVEMNFPPIRFREVGTPAIYLSWARPALFASTMVSDPGNNRERTLYNVGAQVDFRFTLAHRLPMTFSVGYASGFEDGDHMGDEILLSLKIL
jgi:hypothetical protein